MSNSKFRHPSEIKSYVGNLEIISVRITSTTKKIIVKAAKAHGLQPSELYRVILEDYANWLQSVDKNNNK